MFRTVPNHYGVNVNAANAELVNANANVNMVNITNQGSNSTIPAPQPIHLSNLPLTEQLSQKYGNFVMASIVVGTIGGFIGYQQGFDPKVTGLVGATLGWGGYHLVMEHYAQRALANHVNANMAGWGYAG